MDQMPRADDAVEVAVDGSVAGGIGRRGTPQGPFRRFLHGFIHFFSYHLILARQNTRVTRAAGFRLTVRPTVFTRAISSAVSASPSSLAAST